MTPAALAPAALAVLAALMLYRRFRRLFGRQRVQPARMKLRIAVLLVIGAMLMMRGMRQVDFALGVGVGLALGIALAFVGLRWTQFERTPEGFFYTPHAGIGLAVSALLAGRLAYRFIVVYPAVHAAAAVDANPFAAFQRSPLTTAMLCIAIGYYVSYTLGVLARSAQRPH